MQPSKGIYFLTEGKVSVKKSGDKLYTFKFKPFSFFGE